MTMEIDALYAGQPMHNSLDPCSNCAEQAERVRVLLQALQDITDPIAKLRRNLQDGYTLNGAMCVQMANDPETYRRIAREALEATMATIEREPAEACDAILDAMEWEAPPAAAQPAPPPIDNAFVAPGCEQFSSGQSDVSRLLEILGIALDECRRLAEKPVAVPLTKDQVDFILGDSFLAANGSVYSTRIYDFVRAIESAHGITASPT